MEYKKVYTAAELEALVNWFEARRDKLPESLQLDKATHIADFRTTVRHYMDIVREHKSNPTYGGQILHLFKMKEKLEADGLA